MPCSINFSITLQTEILSTETSDFLKQIIVLKSFRVYNEKAIKSGVCPVCLLSQNRAKFLLPKPKNTRPASASRRRVNKH